MLYETVSYSIEQYIKLVEDCFSDEWTFDNTFLFMGSVATTIGYGHIVPKTPGGKTLCISFTLFAVPLFAILLQYISILIDELLVNFTHMFNGKLSKIRGHEINILVQAYQKHLINRTSFIKHL